VNYPKYADAVVIDDGLARPADIADDLTALDLADVRAVRDDATRESQDTEDAEAGDAEHDLRIALLSLLAAEKSYRGRGVDEFADAAAGLRQSTAFLINTAHG